MNKRHRTNRNLTIIPASEYSGRYRLKGNHPMISNYLERIERVMGEAMSRYGRVTMIRVDLRFPKWWDLETCPYQSCISEFIKRLNVLLFNHGIARAHPTYLRYTWCKEFGMESGRPHYHLAIMVSGHAYRPLRHYSTFSSRSLGRVISQAWWDTLGIWDIEGKGLAYFPEKGACSFSSRDLNSQIGAFRQLSYIAKARTKRYGNGYRSFGYSYK